MLFEIMVMYAKQKEKDAILEAWLKKPHNFNTPEKSDMLLAEYL